MPTVRRRRARGFLFLYVGLVIAGGLLLPVGLGLSVGLVVGVPVVVLLAYLPFSLSVRALLRGRTTWTGTATSFP